MNLAHREERLIRRSVTGYDARHHPNHTVPAITTFVRWGGSGEWRASVDE